MKIENLNNKYSGKDCVVMACGPSLLEYPKEKVREFCRGKIVFCVKEAIFEFQDICDLFISNFVRHRDYNITKDSIIKIYQKGIKSPKDLTNYDLILEEDRPFKKCNQLLELKNYEEYSFFNKLKRPWGPGIILESVFYLCQYMGIKNIYTIGFDLFDVKSERNIKHYFEDDNSKIYSQSKRYKNKDFVNEINFINNNLPSFIEYFKKKSNMEIIIIGKLSFINNKIKRINL
jgi:hypothetical protein